MLLTEDEARQKWCPQARAGDGNNRCAIPGATGVDDDVVACIASACMAWRWGEPREVGTDRKCERCNGSGVVVVGHGETAGGEECPACVAGYQAEAVPTGYCGLAGKPDG